MPFSKLRRAALAVIRVRVMPVMRRGVTRMLIMMAAVAALLAGALQPAVAAAGPISPWNNPDCSSYTQVGAATTVYFEYYDAVHDATFDRSLGTAAWRYSSHGTCRGYQWVHFSLNMSAVHTYLGSSPGLWLSVDAYTDIDNYVDQHISFTGGQADGDFLTYAIQVFSDRACTGFYDWTRIPAYPHGVVYLQNGGITGEDWCSV
jgi:hypothetical protein